MRTVFSAVVVMILWAQMCLAQPLTGLARVQAEGSSVRDGWFGETEVTLSLTQGVPFRVFALDAPRRIVVDFREVDFSGLSVADVLPDPGRVSAVRFGAFGPGWSRLVLDLAEPMLPELSEMAVDKRAGSAVLHLSLQSVSPEQFAQKSGAPEPVGWAADDVPDAPVSPPREGFRVVLDPGHGGIDPGAERDGLVEKDLVLDFALTLADILRRDGLDVVLTRSTDTFVSLEGRTALAHQAGASVFVSIHADALSQGGAEGATVYTLSEEASDAASALLAARHDRSDILAGLDLTGADDEVTGVLLDLARRETEPRSLALAKAIVEGMDSAGGPMNRRPRREAGFSVLKSADIPSVLVEIGFLSSARDRKNLGDPVWRSVIAAGLADAIAAWRDSDAARQSLVRQ